MTNVSLRKILQFKCVLFLTEKTIQLTVKI